MGIRYHQCAAMSSPIIRRRKNVKSLRRRDGLIKYARNNTSQNGEDGIIDRIFHLLPPSSDEQRYCVDVGAWDGKHLSNTYSLLVENDGVQDDSPKSNNVNRTTKWKGVMIEADPQRYQELKTLHDPLDNICICAEVSCEPTSEQCLLSILKRDASDLPHDFDFISIDVDGADYWVLANVLGISTPQTNGNADNKQHGYRPKVICIELPSFLEVYCPS